LQFEARAAATSAASTSMAAGNIEKIQPFTYEFNFMEVLTVTEQV
jgi:hypothetical protein